MWGLGKKFRNMWGIYFSVFPVWGRKSKKLCVGNKNSWGLPTLAVIELSSLMQTESCSMRHCVPQSEDETGRQIWAMMKCSAPCHSSELSLMSCSMLNEQWIWHLSGCRFKDSFLSHLGGFQGLEDSCPINVLRGGVAVVGSVWMPELASANYLLINKSS